MTGEFVLLSVLAQVGREPRDKKWLHIADRLLGERFSRRGDEINQRPADVPKRPALCGRGLHRWRVGEKVVEEADVMALLGEVNRFVTQLVEREILVAHRSEVTCPIALASRSGNGNNEGMATDARNGATILTPEQCWERLGSTTLGRLAVAVGSQPDIFPLNFVVIDNTIYLRTVEGSKLASVVINSSVAFEVDGLDEPTNVAWSVVLQGEAEVVADHRIMEQIEDLPWFPWNTAPKNQFIAIKPNRVSGRQFVAEGRVQPGQASGTSA